MNGLLPPVRRRCRGFSLAETALAVGLAASVIVALVGLIPVSLNMLREASVRTAEARIVQALTADYRMRNWQEVLQQQASGGPVDFTFDNQGMRVDKGAPSVIYTARVTVADAEALPGASAFGSNPKLKSLQILITDRPRPEAAFADPRTCRHAQAILAQTDKVVATTTTP